MKKKTPAAGTIVNKRARFDYEIKSTYLAGLVLTGAETKSLRLGHGHLRGAYVTVKDNELWLINATIMPMQTNAAVLDEQTQTRSRKLLMKRKEIDALLEAKKQGLAIVPVKLLTAKRFIKCELAVGRGKKQYDKRETIKKREQGRTISRLG